MTVVVFIAIWDVWFWRVYNHLCCVIRADTPNIQEDISYSWLSFDNTSDLQTTSKKFIILFFLDLWFGYWIDATNLERCIRRMSKFFMKKESWWSILENLPTYRRTGLMIQFCIHFCLSWVLTRSFIPTNKDYKYFPQNTKYPFCYSPCWYCFRYSLNTSS